MPADMIRFGAIASASSQVKPPSRADHMLVCRTALGSPPPSRGAPWTPWYEVVGNYHVGVVADAHDDAPDPARRWQAVAQITRIDSGAQVADAAPGDWFATQEQAVAAALHAGVDKARGLPPGLLGEEAGDPGPG